MRQRNAVACPFCKNIIHVKTENYQYNVFLCPICGGDWEEKKKEDE